MGNGDKIKNLKTVNNQGLKGEGVVRRPRRIRRRAVKFRTSEGWVKFYARVSSRRKKRRL